MQDCGNSSVSALELPQSCTKRLRWTSVADTLDTCLFYTQPFHDKPLKYCLSMICIILPISYGRHWQYEWRLLTISWDLFQFGLTCLVSILRAWCKRSIFSAGSSYSKFTRNCPTNLYYKQINSIYDFEELCQNPLAQLAILPALVLQAMGYVKHCPLHKASAIITWHLDAPRSWRRAFVCAQTELLQTDLKCWIRFLRAILCLANVCDLAESHGINHWNGL